MNDFPKDHSIDTLDDPETDEVVDTEGPTTKQDYFSLSEKKELFYNKLVSVWVNLRLYLDDHRLDWLNRPNSFSAFVDLLTQKNFG